MTSTNNIFLDEPEITEADIDAVTQTLRKGQVSTAHKTTEQFEACMSAFLGVKDCLATNSGTSALHLALIAAGARPGVKVVVPALSFVATANAVKYTGADIEFMDVDPDTWTIFERPVEIGPKDGIILPVFVYGGKAPSFNPFFGAQYDGDRDVKVVFDFAEGIGLRPPSVSVMDSYYCYSFNGNKTVTGGAGGLVACQYPDDIDELRAMVSPRSYDGLAYNYRMPSLNAALVLSQMGLVIKQNNRKREIAKIYKALLPEVEFQSGIENGIVWMVAGLFPEEITITIEALQAALWLSYGIPTRRVFRPLNHYAHLKDGQFYPNAEYIFRNGLCLPSSVKNTDEQIEFVCKTIKELVFA